MRRALLLAILLSSSTASATSEPVHVPDWKCPTAVSDEIREREEREALEAARETSALALALGALGLIGGLAFALGRRLSRGVA